MNSFKWRAHESFPCTDKFVIVRGNDGIVEIILGAFYKPSESIDCWAYVDEVLATLDQSDASTQISEYFLSQIVFDEVVISSQLHVIGVYNHSAEKRYGFRLYKNDVLLLEEWNIETSEKARILAYEAARELEMETPEL